MPRQSLRSSSRTSGAAFRPPGGVRQIWPAARLSVDNCYGLKMEVGRKCQPTYHMCRPSKAVRRGPMRRRRVSVVQLADLNHQQRAVNPHCCGSKKPHSSSIGADPSSPSSCAAKAGACWPELPTPPAERARLGGRAWPVEGDRPAHRLRPAGLQTVDVVAERVEHVEPPGSLRFARESTVLRESVRLPARRWPLRRSPPAPLRLSLPPPALRRAAATDAVRATAPSTTRSQRSAPAPVPGLP